MNYKIEAIKILLDKDCILERYYTLIPYKENLICNLKKAGFNTKNKCFELSSDLLIQLGLQSLEMVNLFKRFLIMYDVKPNKMKEIETFDLSEEEVKIIKELYLLPGVKYVRAKLYFDSGYDLQKIAIGNPEQIINDTINTIKNNGLNLKAPLPKEVRTHIAVARALTEFNVSD